MGKSWEGALVVLASVIGYAVVYGFHYSFSILRQPLKEILDCNMAMVSVVGSVQAGVDMGTGPFACGLIERFGCKWVYLSGSLLLVVSILVSGFLNNWTALVIVFGCFGGVGIGLVNATCNLAPAMYCPKWRGVASGLVQGGGSVALAIPLLVDWILSNVGLRYTMIAMASSGLIVCGFAHIIQPSIDPNVDSTDADCATDQGDQAMERNLSTDERRESLIYPGEVENIGRRRSSVAAPAQTLVNRRTLKARVGLK